MNGVLVLDKPRGMSSASAVHHVKQRLGAKRAGHGGTLDPIATGVLPICLDEATKLAQYLLADDKEYEADLVLGVETDTYDRTGTVTSTRPAEHVTREMIERALAARVGEQDQLPPVFSAIKQGGVRMYHRARAGEPIERTPRRVRIDRLALLDFTPPVLRVAIACSKGTYVRSIVADLGTDLGVGAHMTELRRTRSGTFTIAQAHDLDRLDNCRIVPLEQATRLPIVVASEDHVTKIRNGLQLPPDTLHVAPEIYEKFQLFNEAQKLVAVAHVEANKVIYDRVFAP
ncbi:MAG TPA: tRNA pseudouridine(55) synthase TruB [Kofleriaceae bacterium]|nr:tRNA pseudouridine(55) synthase TruB [Kofleriaceae bacterium]